jgi:glycosyltransferase involved in cell wall biosynthesis
MSTVSVIVPCYNEQSTIRELLSAIYSQTYPGTKIEVIIADGMSTDGTRQEIKKFQADHPDFSIQVVDNIHQSIPSGLNQAIKASTNEYIIRLDAHSSPYVDYVEQCVEALQASLGDTVGGIWQIQPGSSGWQARAIAASAAHPFGVGDARYRVGGDAQAVDTVPFGSFHRSLVERIGYYDETLLTNEDYEFNARIRQNGGTVWYDPKIRSIYYSRPTLHALANQYWRYGYWKARMIRRYPKTLRWRQLLPPLFVLSLLVLSLLSTAIPGLLWLLIFELGLYMVVLLIAGFQLALRKRDIIMILSVPLVIATMHITWGVAFLWSLIRGSQKL